MKCTECSTELEKHFKVCPECATPVQKITPTCKQCDAQLQPSFKVCPECGAAVQDIASASNTIPCPNVTKAGNLCSKPLKSSQKFCGGCRWKVNTKLFLPGAQSCGAVNENGAICINIIGPDEDFCTECGANVVRLDAQGHGFSGEANGTAEKTNNATNLTKAPDQESNREQLESGHTDRGAEGEILTGNVSGDSRNSEADSVEKALDTTTNDKRHNLGNTDDGNISGNDEKRDSVSVPTDEELNKCSLPSHPESQDPDRVLNPDDGTAYFPESQESSMKMDPKRPLYAPKTENNNNNNVERLSSEEKGSDSWEAPSDFNALAEMKPGSESWVAPSTSNVCTETRATLVLSQQQKTEQGVDDTKTTEHIVQSSGEGEKVPSDTGSRAESENQRRNNTGVEDTRAENDSKEGHDTKQDSRESIQKDSSLDSSNIQSDSIVPSQPGEDNEETDSSESDSESESIQGTDATKTGDRDTVKRKGKSRLKCREKKKQKYAAKKQRKSDRIKAAKDDKMDMSLSSKKTETPSPYPENLPAASGLPEAGNTHSNKPDQQGGSSKKDEEDTQSSTSWDTNVDEVSDHTQTENKSLSKGKEESGNATKEKMTSVAQRTRSQDSVEVHFHAIASPKFMPNPETSIVYIRILHDDFGKGDLSHKMTVKRKLANNYIELHSKMPVPKYMIMRAENIRYRYAVKEMEEGNAVDEYFYDCNSRNNRGLRNLLLPEDKRRKAEIWHQFDGVIQTDPDPSKWKQLKDYFVGKSYEDTLKKDAELTVQTFFPAWKGLFEDTNRPTFSPKECFDIMEMLHYGIRRNYYFRTTIWYLVEKMTESIGETVKKMLQKSKALKAIRAANPNTESQNFLSTVSLLILFHKLGVDLDESDKLSFCRCLLIDVDIEKQQSPKWNLFQEEFEGMKSDFKPALRQLLQVGERTYNPEWLYCVPLWHFLSGNCKPFDKLPQECRHDAPVPKWWGVEEIKEEIEYFKAKTRWTIPPADLVKSLSSVFQADYLMPRTIVAVLHLENLVDVVKTKLIPPEITLAAVFYHLKTKAYIDGIKRQLLMLFQLLSEQIVECQKQDEENTGDTHLLNGLWICHKIAADVIKICLKKCRTYLADLMCHAVEAYLLSVTHYHSCSRIRAEQSKGKKKNPDESHLNQLNQLKTEVISWLRDNSSSFSYAKNELMTWNRLVSVQMAEGEIKEQWNKDILQSLEDKLISKCLERNLMELYCKESEDFSMPVMGILSKAAFKALEKGAKLELDGMNVDQALQYGRMLSQLFEKNWKTHHGALFHFTLSWPPFVHFLKIFHGNVDKLQVLSQECQGHINSAADLIRKVFGELMNGKIRVKDLNNLQNHADVFAEITSIVHVTEDKTGESQEVIKRSIQLRKQEVRKFLEVQEHVKNFIGMCQHFNVDTRKLDQSVARVQNLDEVSVSDLCQPGDVTVILKLEEHVPTVTAFGLSEDIHQAFRELSRTSQSTIFSDIWIKQGQLTCKEKGSCLTVDDVLTSVMNPAYKQWTVLAEKLQNGTILFSEFKKFFKRPDYVFIEEELRKMSTEGDIAWIPERLKQIKQHTTIRQCTHGAKVLLEVVKAYSLKGNFDKVNQILNLEQGKDTEMKDIDDSLMNTCSVLKGMGEREMASLEVFIICKPLVDWLRSSMKTGLKELKVFVELASISAGEGDMEVAKVNLLHAATTGYAPLIFNLDENCDYVRFLDKCQVVWKELAADPNLPKKLEDITRQLEWLKTVKQAHGSVEVSSMRQAEAINSVGIYCVGKLPKYRHEHKQKLSIEEVLQLMVHEEEEGRQLKKEYHHKELNELQSKLMLVAGKAEQGKADVDKFTLVYDSIIRLCKVYIKLIAAGCVLFKDWHAQFLCDPGRQVCAFVKFGHGQGCTQLKGRRKDTVDIDQIVPRLAKFMEKCLDEWLKYIEKKREEYLYLNYFTVDQLVILQRELVKLSEDNEPSKLVYPLLCAVKNNCTKADLIAAMKQAKKDVTDMEKQRDEEIIPEDVLKAPDNDADVLKFVDEMQKAGYSREIAIAALQFVKPDEIDEGIVWCMENESQLGTRQTDGTEGMQEPQEDTDADRGFEGWTKTPKSLPSIIQDIIYSLNQDSWNVEEDPLIISLQSVWEKFLYSVSSSVSDYLSIEHLGLILKRLAEKNTVVVKRNLLSCFENSKPNLLICPQEEVLSTVLTIYGNDPDQPLPQADEVLLCTPQTTLDEVDIFWRRAIFSSNGRIYCMVNGDNLDYEVSDEGEKRLEKHMQIASEQGCFYQLVVICSSELEYRSRIVAALDKYRCHRLPLQREGEIRNYILAKLQDHSRNTVSAASVDFEKSTVRVVKSWRAGVGKTLYKKRRAEEVLKLKYLKPQTEAVVTIPIHEREVNTDQVMEKLTKYTLNAGTTQPRLFHIDMYHEVEEGLDTFLFQLLILGCLTDSSGYVWRKLPCDMYIVEAMPMLDRDSALQEGRFKCKHKAFDILPDVVCRSPQECVEIVQGGQTPRDHSQTDVLFDDREFRSAMFQRPYQYLLRLDNNRGLADVNPSQPEGDMKLCLQTLLAHCGVVDPSWSELKHFVWFLNNQLLDFEVSAYCSLAAVEDLPGFAQFVLKFLIQMSRDFATRSLNMSEESPVQKMKVTDGGATQDLLDVYKLRRTWESSPHPYLFFNPDHHSMTFLGFTINPQTGDLIDQQTRQPLERGIMKKNLFDALQRNSVNLNENFDNLPRDKKIEKLCSVMGVEFPHDPDDTYELTTDNVKKILAIYMRFRCDIPVIIMGETGCGKTRLIKFMCSLQCPPGVQVQNMVLMKVHGGTKSSDIIKKVHQAEELAKTNTNIDSKMYTVLFFDEANTTEAIGTIKEIMCDKTMDGEPLKLCNSLKIVAACNPYRKHSEELIRRLEQAGLGYHVDADNTTDRMGRVPMRRLVYRVQPLPQSMLPLVWDFGQLNTDIEEMYIKQMVLRFIRNGKLPTVAGLESVVSKILTVSQEFMRKLKDECSFVSLRDVERVLEVMSWFYKQSSGNQGTELFQQMNQNIQQMDDLDEELVDHGDEQNIDVITRSLILGLGVCYHACLKKRRAYRKAVCPHFTGPCRLQGGENQMLEEIVRCQDIFLENVQLGQNIARNQALKENVFMMVVCIELRIPLFLVGKPGSSKSLAKTIVADAMQGNAAHKQLFKSYKQVQMVSFQCSPLSVPEGIVGTFRQCAMYQKDKDLNRFVSVVVLDEVGLAEDSPKMPLKTLHPLLEDGCQGDEEPAPHKKVAFIGISNWALDPAKMNRGILVQREVPDLQELMESAQGICSEDRRVLNLIKHLVEPMAKSYLELFDIVLRKREFFGLRDFYSLLKMVYGFAYEHGRKPSWHMLKHAILRNFGGFEGIDPVKVFTKHLTSVNQNQQFNRECDPDSSPAGLIEACLLGNQNRETRYLLLLTENYGALSVLQQKVHTIKNAITIFGSSFPSDQEYTQVCRNINRIKVCMETGNTVVLLNLENLYESLYDALNQYYVYFGGERYVDLGLGTHRVKCRVHQEFRLIVVAEKEMVYGQFPIPLINRLEKHFLTISNMLTGEQLQLAQQLEVWAEKFVSVNVPQYMQNRKKQSKVKVEEVFMGYHADTCASIILHVCKGTGIKSHDLQAVSTEILEEAKKVLLWCATPDAVLRLKETSIRAESEKFNKIYFKEQKHESLIHYLAHKIRHEEYEQLDHLENIFIQVTTHSKLLSTVDIDEISAYLHIPRNNISLLTLQSFDTEQQFCRQVRASLEERPDEETLLMVQCDSGDQNAALVACARYSVHDELQKLESIRSGRTCIVFIVQLPSIAAGCFSGFQCGLWHSVHLDELRPQEKDMPTIVDLKGKSLGALLKTSERKHKEPLNLLDLPEEMECRHVETGTQDVPMDLDVDENEIILMHEDLNAGQVPREKHYDIGGLIRACVQPSLAMVKDMEKNSTRATERVKLLLKLIHERDERDHETFLHGLCNHLAALMKEREEHLGHGDSDWLMNEAAKPENIKRAGTFRKALKQCLIDKMTPVLAGTIAYIDTNMNLDILAKSDHEAQWKQGLWLSIFSNTNATDMHYAGLLSPSKQEELEEVVVKGTSCEGGVFAAQMPFSWLIYRLVSQTVKVSENIDRHDEIFDEIERVALVIQDTPLGKILKASRLHTVDRIKAYTSDFVYMVYPVTSEQEYQLVCESLLCASVQSLRGNNKDFIQMLSAIHVTHNLVSPRLKNYSSITRVWQECSSNLQTFQQSSPQFYLITDQELTLDVFGLHLLLENLEPKKDALNTKVGRSVWLQRVHQYRPVVEQIMGQFKSSEGQEEEERIFGRRSMQGTHEAKLRWSRVILTKLFIDHVCTVVDQDVKRIMPLWVMFKDGADMKTIHSLEKIEKFLISCNKEMVTSCYGKQQVCQNCETPITSRPVQLPCQDVICSRCFEEMNMLKSGECPACHRNVPDGFIPSSGDSKRRIADQKYLQYRGRCNTFFMEIVSQLCFSENTAPSSEVIEKLLTYITRSSSKGQGRMFTREMTVFGDGLDPTPVFRSFLLQLLIRASPEQVNKFLENYLQKADEIMRSNRKEKESQFIELCLLVIQCLEDSFEREVSSSDSKVEEIKQATSMLEHNCDYLIVEQLDVHKLYCLAEVRYGLTVAAKYLHKTVVEKSIPLDGSVRKMLDTAAALCDKSGSKWPRLFLVKQLCRCYGIESYYTVCRKAANPAIARWVTLPELCQDKIVECPDRFIVNGDVYTEMRDKLTQAALAQDDKIITDMLQSLSVSEWIASTNLSLAVFKEFSMSYLHSPEKRRLSSEVFNHMLEILCAQPLLRGQVALVKALMENTLWRQNGTLNITEGMDLGQQNLATLMVHMLTLFKQLPGNSSLIEPLKRLANQPQHMKRAMLPTMHQDEVEEIRQALLAARRDHPNENPVLYRCPNGHPYVIGDCGRPATVGRCKECHQEIGGTGYQLRQGNIQDQGLDHTQTGHILGRAENRPLIASPERTLSPVQCAILRLFTHIAMFIGANENPQAVTDIIKPDVQAQEVMQFLLQHIQVDIRCIQNGLGRSTDDVFLLLHYVCHIITTRHNPNENLRPETCGLQTKECRASWEDSFVRSVLTDTLQNVDRVLKKLNQRIVKDKRLGSDPLLCLLFETDTPTQQVVVTQIHNTPAVWRYRTQISIKHLSHTFLTQVTGGSCPVLDKFLREEQHLRAIRHVPSIMRLQRQLIQKYQRKLDRAEANAMSIGEAIETEGEELEQLVQDFMEAWECVRANLTTFNVPVDSTIQTVPKEYCLKPICWESPLSVLLPTHRDAGLCSYGLLYYLLNKQNSFLKEIKGNGLSNQPRITLQELSTAHLITYHPDKDIMPMVLANCSYSFEVGKGTKIDYNFPDFERQLRDRFLFSKSVIQLTVDEFDLMVYRSESTDAVVFKKLRERMKQEQLNSGIRRQICDELRTYEEVCECLDKLDIAISFLKSVSVESSTSLDQFMSQSLKMEQAIPSQKARQTCSCKHVQSLWISLSYLKTTYQATYKQDAFESITEEFREDLSKEQRVIVETVCAEIPPERLEVILDILFECIMLTISVPQNPDDDDFVDMKKLSLRDVLIGHITSPKYDVAVEHENPEWVVNLIGKIPGSMDDKTRILTSHSVDVWLLLYALHGKKIKQ